MTGLCTFTRDDNNNNILNTEALLLTFIEHVLKSADRYTDDAGRNTITEEDMLYALKYESHVFFHHPDTHSDFEKYRQWQEEEEEEEEETETEWDDDDDEFSRCEATPFCRRVNGIVDSWDEWNPSDPVQQSIKRCLDDTCER